MTKKEQGFKQNYDRATARELWQVYDSFSRKKARALDHCREAQYMLNGYDGRICSACCNFFTYAFRYRDAEGKERLQYHTHANVYDFALA